MLTEGFELPGVVWQCRELVPQDEGDPIFDWVTHNTFEYFAGKRVVLFALPGAFTPTCSSFQLPGYEEKYEEFKALGIDEVYCLSVNDSFVMNAWFKDQAIANVKAIPDGNAHFTSRVGMQVSKENLGFGIRTWRYAAVVNDGKIEKVFIEPGMEGNCPTDPYEVSDPETVLNYLKGN